MGCVMIMAGGTGGHVFPALALASELQQRGQAVFWLGVPDSFEARVVGATGIPMEWVQLQGLRGSGWRRALAAPFRLVTALVRTYAILRRRRPGLVVGMGGFVTGPGGVAARLMGLPLVIHEQNRLPGLTNRLLARIANRVLEAFPGSFAPMDKLISLGNPIRPEIAALPPPGPVHQPPHLLVVGGSLGAQALNIALAPAIASLPVELRPLIRHQAGRHKQPETLAAYAAAGLEAEVSEFIDDMAAAYAWADLVVCRAGALTVSELAAAGKAAILVPYPHAVDDHQTANAEVLAEVGGARIVQQQDFPSGVLNDTLGELLANPTLLTAMGRKANSRAVRDAAARMADICIAMMETTRP